MMRLLSWLKRQFTAWRRRGSTRKQLPPLREFIYLDDVSVYSLLASRLGPIATQFTETERATLQGEAASTVGTSVPGIARAEASGRAATIHTKETQVLKKALVQTTFKKLHDLEADALVLREPDDDLGPPSCRTLESIIARSDSLTKEGWVVDPSGLSRGQLIDTEVQLVADPVFRVSAVVSVILDILEGNPELFGGAFPALSEVRSVGLVLEKLLAGLVPIRGRSVTYSVLEADAEHWLVHSRLANALDPAAAQNLLPLYVVGVAEQALFWRDIRRVLFSGMRFRVFGRLARDAIHTTWTPVKLAQVLESIVPGLGKQIEDLGAGAMAAMTGSAATPGIEELRRTRFASALLRFAELLDTHYEGTVTEDDLIQAGLPSDRSLGAYNSLAGRRDAFDEIGQFVCDRLNVERDNLIFARYRQAALLDAELDLSANPLSVARSPEMTAEDPSEERFLDTEFVAIYW